MNDRQAYCEILSFWFDEIDPKSWWSAQRKFDQLVATRFGATLQRAAQGECCGWRAEPDGRLAEIIVLDQFSRNIHRGTPLAFAHDPMALTLAQWAVADNAHLKLDPAQCTFLLMPYMHSESRVVHEIAEVLFREHAPKSNYEFELRHKVIIDRFGRYPHRNEILGRKSSAAEIEFLKQPGSSF
ncbi:MAG: DUF924 family protein [Rudaea sp.]